MIPKILENIQAQNQSITYRGCLTQISFVPTFVCWENFLLLVIMAYDRYVAICHPLRYTVSMNPRLCVQLILLSLFISIADALFHSLMLLQLSFCTDLEISLFCEVVQVIKLACSDTLINNILVYFAAGIFAGVPLSGIIFSYIQIVSSILKMPSSGRK